MKEVQIWASTVCLAVLAASVLSYCAPRGAMERPFRLVLSAFAMLSLLSPLSKLLQTDFIGELRGLHTSVMQTELQETVDQQILQTLKGNLTSLTAAELLQMQLFSEKIEIFTDTADDGSIVINRISVVLPQKDAGMCVAAAEALEHALGVPTEVTVDGTG